MYMVLVRILLTERNRWNRYIKDKEGDAVQYEYNCVPLTESLPLRWSLKSIRQIIQERNGFTICFKTQEVATSGFVTKPHLKLTKQLSRQQ